MAEFLDVTQTVGENLRRARGYGRSRLLLVVSAENCPGCSRLDEQLKEPELRQMLLGSAYVCRMKVGDLYNDPPAAIRIGSWTLRSPGFPTSWLWDIDEAGLHFLALALGPLGDDAPKQDLSRLFSGSSYRVPEAAGIRIQVESPDSEHLLSETNDFWAQFTVPLGSPSDDSTPA